MNDWFDYKGSGSSRAIQHSYKSSQEQASAQKAAYDRLRKSLVNKAYKYLNELQAAQDSVIKIDNAIHEKTSKDKNYNINGLLQRKKTYLVRRSTINNELDNTITEIANITHKMWSEYGYSALDIIGRDPDLETNTAIKRIKTLQKQILQYS